MMQTFGAPEFREKVDALLARMSLDQTIGQMTQGERAFVTPEDVREYHLGSVLSGGGSCPGDNLPADWVAMNDAYWAASLEEAPGRVPVPIIYGVDAIHGNNNVVGWPGVQRSFREVLITGGRLVGKGALRKKECVTHIVAGALFDHSTALGELGVKPRSFR